MLGFEKLQRLYLNLKARDGASLNGRWQRTRRLFLKKVGKICACCGSVKKIEVHHKVPRHICPERTHDETNLIALCGGGKGCHFHIGHLNSYFTYNEEVFKVCMYVHKHSIKKSNK